MTQFLGMMRLSAAEATRMVQDGPSTRRQFLDRIVHAADGELRGMWLTSAGDWDVVVLVDVPDGSSAAGAAATLARRAAGLTDAERWIELVEVDDVARALEAMS